MTLSDLTSKQAEDVLIKTQEALVEMSLPSQRIAVSQRRQAEVLSLTLPQYLLRSHASARQRLQEALAQRSQPVPDVSAPPYKPEASD